MEGEGLSWKQEAFVIDRIRFRRMHRPGVVESYQSSYSEIALETTVSPWWGVAASFAPAIPSYSDLVSE